MPAFRYSGRSSRGDAVSGVLEADSPESLANHLFERGITPIDIKAAAASRDVLADLKRRLGGGRPKLTDLILFSRQMFSITKAGIPLLRGIGTLASSTPNLILREALLSVVEHLQAGRDLATALSRHPEVFSKFYVSIVRVGESTGTLSVAFERMFEYLVMEKRIRDKLATAMRYPATVVVAIAIAIAIITMFVLPKFVPIFESLGDNLPWSTRVLLGVSDFFSSYWYVVAAMAFAFYAGFRLYLRHDDGRYRFDKFKLRLPIVGSIAMKAGMARICRSFALTLESGVPAVQGLNMIARAAGNEYLGEGVLALRNGVERGESLSRAAQMLDIFTPLALQMLRIGEETGELSPLLTEVADFYEREVDYELENIGQALEPLLILAVGIMVLILALGVFLPLWDMAASGGGLS
jgi:MSHA biogenesis protein MshG